MTKILLVEDDKSLREIYGVRLLAEGYDIVSAGDGEEALAMAIKDRPVLILSDVMMPKISGFDMLDILRSTTETKDIKVIMMTALSSEEQRQRGVALGADRYLVKSQVGIEDVVRTVHEVLADAPVAGQSPLMQPKPAPAPPSIPAAPISAGPGARPAAPVSSVLNTPAAQPAPLPTPTPVSVPSAPAPTPTSTPSSMPSAPSETAMPTPTLSPVQESTLPQPTAPFSTPRVGTLADRVIQPLESDKSQAPDFSSMIDKELSGSTTAPSIPTPQPTPQPTPMPSPAPISEPPATSGLNFEETPRPMTPTPAPTNWSQPPQPPQSGV